MFPGKCNLLGLYFLIEIFSLINISKIKTDSSDDQCISWKDLEEAYKDKIKALENLNQTNSTEVGDADDLQVDKEQIKRLPVPPNGGPVEITMTFFIDDINTISDVNMDFILDFYYMQKWTVYGKDCQSYKNSLKMRKISLENVDQNSKLTISNEYFNLFWLPDIMIANAKKIHQQSEVIDTTLLIIYFDNSLKGPNQELCQMEYLARFASVVSCPMDFHDAPIDTQICSIQLRSFAFNQDKIRLVWDDFQSVEQNPDIKLLEHDWNIWTEQTNTSLFSENYSVLKIQIKFNRKIANKMVGVYTPSILIVLITFCSFWLGLNTTSERVTIGITALLALVTQFNDVRHSLPPTSYISEIDKWMIMCMVFVSAQMVQCTVIDFVYHHQQYNQKTKDKANKVVQMFRRNSIYQNSLRVPDGTPQLYIKPIRVNLYERILSNPNVKTFTLTKGKYPERVETNQWISLIWKVFSKLTPVPTTPDKPEYLPMKIDAVSRLIFPLFLFSMCMFYWPTMLLKTF